METTGRHHQRHHSSSRPIRSLVHVRVRVFVLGPRSTCVKIYILYIDIILIYGDGAARLSRFLLEFVRKDATKNEGETTTTLEKEDQIYGKKKKYIYCENDAELHMLRLG